MVYNPNIRIIDGNNVPSLTSVRVATCNLSSHPRLTTNLPQVSSTTFVFDSLLLVVSMCLGDMCFLSVEIYYDDMC